LDYGGYKNKKEACRYTSQKIVAKVKNYKLLPKNENKIKQELYQNGPIAAGINAKYL